MGVCAPAASGTTHKPMPSSATLAVNVIERPPFCLKLVRFLLRSQRAPDASAQVHKGVEVHHVFDPGKAVPALGLTHGLYVEDFLDAAGTPSHHHHPIGEIDRLLDRMGDEQDGA